MTEDQATSLAGQMLAQLMPQLPNNEDRSLVLTGLMLASYELLRAIEGDEFVAGWLDGAKSALKTQPPALLPQRAAH